MPLSRTPAPDGFPPVRKVGPYTEVRVPSGLAESVSAAWSYRTFPGDRSAPHRVLPTAGVVVCILSRVDADGREHDPCPLLFGPVRTVRTFLPVPGVRMEGVEVRPEWSRAVLGVAPEEHVDRVVPLADVDPLPVGLILSLAGVNGGAADRLDALFTWLRMRGLAATPDPMTRLAAAALRRLLRTREGRVDRVAEFLGISTRHLHRCVTTIAGDGPKQLQRIERLNRIVARADGLGAPRWTDLAVRYGFYDQPHLIQEVRSLTGVSPAALHAERRAESTPG